MNSDPAIQEVQNHSYPLMSGWPYMTSAMPDPLIGQKGTMIPRVNIVETDSSIVYYCDLAGADGSKLSLEISALEIAINAPAPSPAAKHPNSRYIYQERPNGSYARLLITPANVNIDKVEANYNSNGILEIIFPKLSPES
ncbi:MAG: Hsp20/alpha crystallin family protein [Desulfotomaculaceae bacterium]|nr:Hsp20/alpha crystallin family protein [Desulfotomaculaceae bacterium]